LMIGWMNKVSFDSINEEVQNWNDKIS
jgi:hypothetical protein